MKKIAVIDYEMGNVNSVIGAINKIGHQAVFTRDNQDIRNCDAIILPGVGSFRDGMAHLKKFNLDEILKEQVVANKKPFLGICLGMQMLATTGREFGDSEGLGWIEGEVVKFTEAEGFKIPHVGWNEIDIEKEDPLFLDVKKKLFYFVHSYYFKVKNPENVLARCEYSERFASVVRFQNIAGVQFHPEKSQSEGLLLIRNFIETGSKC